MTGAPASQTGCSSLRDQAPAGLDHSASPPRAAFTPGPWDAHPSHVSVPGKGAVATIQNPWNNKAEFEANVRLIAAAPSMYADAEFLCARIRELESDLADDDGAHHYYGHVVPALARMESCLAEARGEQP